VSIGATLRQYCSARKCQTSPRLLRGTPENINTLVKLSSSVTNQQLNALFYLFSNVVSTVGFISCKIIINMMIMNSKLYK